MRESRCRWLLGDRVGEGDSPAAPHAKVVGRTDATRVKIGRSIVQSRGGYVYVYDYEYTPRDGTVRQKGRCKRARKGRKGR